MTTVETLLRQFLQHPKRGWIVIILTSVLGLVTLWPVVDEYCVLSEDCAQLELSIVQAQQEASMVDSLRELATKRASELAQVRQQTLVVQDIHEFSSKLVEISRGTGCQLRRVDLGEVQKRKWSEKEHPLKVAAHNKEEAPYELRTQRVVLSVSGSMEQVQALLGELRALNKLVHTQGIQIKPVSEQRREVNLDLDLLFFDLKRTKKSVSS